MCISCSKAVLTGFVRFASRRLQIMGACDSMITFTTTFTKSPIRVIEMKKMKLTYRIIDKFTVVRA